MPGQGTWQAGRVPPQPSPAGATHLAEPRCADDSGSFCHTVWDSTHTDWLARWADGVISPLAHIVLIIVIALVVRFGLHRLIRRLVQTTGQGAVPTALRPLRERMSLKENGIVGRFADAATKLAERRQQRAETIGSVLRSIVSFTIATIAFILVLGEVGIDLRPIIASAGIAGIAIGFGAQNLVKDFIAGMFMILEDQYGVGDSVDLGQASGLVEAVGLRTTRVRDLSGTVWYVRNGEVLRVGNRGQGSAETALDIRLENYADAGRANVAVTDVLDALWHDEVFAASILRVPEVRAVGPGGSPLPVDTIGAAEGGAAAVDLRVSISCRAGDTRRLESELRSRLATRFAADRISSPDLPVPEPPPSDTHSA